MSDILELSCSVLSSVLEKDLFTTWMFEISHVVYFAVDQEPDRFFRIVAKYVVEISEYLKFFNSSNRSFDWTTLLCHFNKLSFSKLINLLLKRSMELVVVNGANNIAKSMIRGLTATGLYSKVRLLDYHVHR